MLVRKGTMLHRASTRRHSRRNSTAVRAPGGRERSASVGPVSSSSLSSSTAGHSISHLNASPDRRFSRATIASAPSTSFLTSAVSSGGNVEDGKQLLGQQQQQKPGLSSSTSLVVQQGESRRMSSIHSQVSTLHLNCFNLNCQLG